jgi:hypothetical protein
MSIESFPHIIMNSSIKNKTEMLPNRLHKFTVAQQVQFSVSVKQSGQFACDDSLRFSYHLSSVHQYSPAKENI